LDIVNALVQQDYNLKGDTPYEITGYSLSGRLPHLLASEISLSKICMFQPKEWATV
jgi:hypothetical protein